MINEIVLFLIILFFYIHISYHIKTSNYQDIYELTESEPLKITLEKICSMKQPVVFNYQQQHKNPNECKLLKPAMCINSILNTDISCNKFQYDIYHRKYIYSDLSNVEIELISPNNIENLDIKRDDINMKYYVDNIKDIPTKKVTLSSGEMIYVPAYWLYKTNNIVNEINYHSIFSIISVMGYYFWHFIQGTNIRIITDKYKKKNGDHHGGESV